MQYQMIPMGEIWNDGIINLPKQIVTKYLKFASVYQLKALLLILANNGTSNSKEISKALGCTENDATEFLEFWVEEGLLAKDGKTVEKATSAPPIAEEEKPKAKEKPKEEKKETLAPPSLSRSDILLMCKQNDELLQIMQSAQAVLGTTLSQSDQELIINMVNYYGLPGDIVLTILQYYKKEKDKGVSIGKAYITAMAKNWSEEGILTLEDADEKLKELEASDRLWKEVRALMGVKHPRPTPKQREMIKSWRKDFSMEMISLACDIMRENTEKPVPNYVDRVLKNWKKKGISTPNDVEENEKSFQQNAKKNISKPVIDETYDIDEISRRAMLNDNYDI